MYTSLSSNLNLRVVRATCGFALTLTTVSALLLAATSSQADDTSQQISAEELQVPTRVVTLGTGTPSIDAGRAGTATAVIVNQDQVYLFDAGSGFMQTLGRFEAEGKRDIFPATSPNPNAMLPTFLDKLFLTHLDSDHILGIPALLLRGWVLERDHPVRIWGPAGTRTVVDGVVEAYQPDIQHRLGSLPISKEAPYTGIVEELGSDPGTVYQDRYVTISAFNVDHGNWAQGKAYGYRIEAPDKTIVISGDTRPTPNLLEHAKGADILLHEVMSVAGMETMSEDWQHYMLDAHTTTRQLADIAREIDPELLVMIHPLFLGAPEETLLEEMQAVYDGNVTLADDGDVFE
ncbi:MBL fold metallo-hydrolase [Halomonas elongata]|uniref:MBL fold metallo-hydrolase n=1 Tax=Halomonas elongata TaxID=2746 RepID=UPI00403481BF